MSAGQAIPGSPVFHCSGRRTQLFSATAKASWACTARGTAFWCSTASVDLRWQAQPGTIADNLPDEAPGLVIEQCCRSIGLSQRKSGQSVVTGGSGVAGKILAEHEVRQHVLRKRSRGIVLVDDMQRQALGIASLR